MINVTQRLRDLVADPELGVSMGFLQQVLAYIEDLEGRLQRLPGNDDDPDAERE
jgi:hypothetical protein